MENKEFLTRTECTAMKGIAILGIMLHNYCHWLKDIARENEYTWSAWKNDYFWNAVLHPDLNLPLHILSYFGHYGVPVFLFLSGYGLVQKYEHQQENIGVWRFTRYNYLKLFRILIVGFVLFLLVDNITYAPHRYEFSEALGMLGMFSNLFEDPSHVIWPGPYWYFGLTLQFYLLYRLVLYRRHWLVSLCLVVICWFLQYNALDDSELLERLRYNFIGGMLPFAMGLWLGNAKFSVNSYWSLAALLLSLLVIPLSFSASLWLWIPPFIVLGTIGLVKLLPKHMLPYVVWLGTVSAAIFVTHPIVRKIFVRPYLRDDLYAGLLLYVVCTLLLSWLVKKVIDQIPKPKL